LVNLPELSDFDFILNGGLRFPVGKFPSLIYKLKRGVPCHNKLEVRQNDFVDSSASKTRAMAQFQIPLAQQVSPLLAAER
jgi:hypothetical protein